MECFGEAPHYVQPQVMFKTLRRLHSHNLENRGLNNLTEAFQNFMTRAKFFSVGRLRRTWSHSAVEFLKYRRLLPMIVSDEHSIGSAFEDFNQSPFSTKAVKPEDKRVIVSNASIRATSSQIQSFFFKFGQVQSCQMVTENRRQSIYGTISKHTKKSCTFYVTFKKEESAVKAKQASLDELTFYGQQMVVTSYVLSGGRKQANSIRNLVTTSVHGDNGLSFSVQSSSSDNEGLLSRSSSLVSISSNETISSKDSSTCALIMEEFPPRVLERIFCFLDPLDRIRLERVNKRWLEAAAKAWSTCADLSFQRNTEKTARHSIFNNSNPLCDLHLKAFLRRCGPQLQYLDFSNVVNLLGDNAIDEIAHRCPNLIHLDISGISATPNALCLLSESLQKLRSIAYRGMKNANERHFWNLFKFNSKSISTVDLRGCRRLRGRCFKLFGAKLSKVLLDGCILIDDEVIEDLLTRSMGLQELGISGCKNLTDESLSLISRNLLDLTKLSLNGENFTKFTSEGLQQLGRLSALRMISFDYNICVSDKIIEALVDGVPELRSLSLPFSGSDTSISSKSLLRLIKLEHLTEIDISGIAAVNNSVFTALSSCPNLNKLIARNCSYVGDKGVEALGQLEKVIKQIDLSGCILVTSKSIQILLKKFHATEKKENLLPMVSLVIGGTVCEKSNIRIPPNCRVHLDFNDYSALNLNAAKEFLMDYSNQGDDVDCDDEFLHDEFNFISAHRSFVADALNEEDDSPILENDKSILEWAEKEAAELGLV